MISVKICGIKQEEILTLADHLGVQFVGFVLYQKSPRSLAREEAKKLFLECPKGLKKVALFVNPQDDELDYFLSELSPDYIQLHGDEDVRRTHAIREKSQCPIIKAIGIHDRKDLDSISSFESVCSFTLLDAKAPKGTRPGGNAHSFDWSLLKGQHFKKPWFLAGGLSLENIEEAITVSGANWVDLSSSLEETMGVKSPSKIRNFMHQISKIRSESYSNFDA